MKMKVNGRRGVFWQHTFEGENVRLPNRLNALERLEQRLHAHLPTPGIPSSAERVEDFEWLSWWNVMAKRCVSSWT